jgi:hypothetical protein
MSSVAQFTIGPFHVRWSSGRDGGFYELLRDGRVVQVYPNSEAGKASAIQSAKRRARTVMPNPRRRNPDLGAFAEKRTKHSVTYVLNVPATTGGIMGSMPRDQWEAGHAHYFVVHKTGNGDGRWGIGGGLGRHGGRYNAMLGRVTYATPEEAAAALDAYIPKGAGNFIHRSNPARAKRNHADPLACGPGPIPPRVAQAAAAILGWAETERIVGPGLLSGASGYDLRRLVHAAKVERERQGGKPAITRRKQKNPARRALTWIPVGGGHVATHGDSTYTLARTTRAFSFTGGEKIPVWTVTVQTADRQPYEVTAAWPLSEAKTRANTHAGTTFNKWKPAKGWQPNPRRNPAPTPQMVTADDVWAWSVRLRPATPEVKRLAKAAGMPRSGDRKFWAGEMLGVLMDEHPGDNALAYFLDHLERFT